MIVRLLFGSLRRRLRHLALIAVASTVAAGTVAATAGLGARLETGLQSALHEAGPNLVVRPQVGGPDRLPADALGAVESTPGVLVAAAVAELRDEVPDGGAAAGVPLVAVSSRFFSLHPDWEIDGRPPAPGEDGGEALVGARVAADVVASLEAGGAGGLRVVGRLTTGEDLDRAVVVPLEGSAPAAGSDGSAGSIGSRSAPRPAGSSRSRRRSRVAWPAPRPGPWSG